MKNIENYDSIILLLDPRGLLSSKNEATINRYKEYALNLSKYNKKIFLVSFSASTEVNTSIFYYRNLSIHYLSRPTFNSLFFALKAGFYSYKFRKKIDLIISGDPWESFLSSYILKKFLGRDIPIQIQIHGDIADVNWRKMNLVNYFRFRFAKIAILKAQSIRCVGVRQSQKLLETYRFNKNKLVVVPVPIENCLALQVNSKIPRSIGFVGRIHKDRGTREFIELIRKLSTHAGNFNLVIAGDGPDKIFFLQELQKVLPPSRIKYLGQISHKKLRSSWKYIGILVSMAPVESYGRVMRESLVAGIPVWATKSSGVLDLIDTAVPGTVKILNLDKDINNLYLDFEKLLKVRVGITFRNKFIIENNLFAERLVSSWIKVIQASK